MSKVRIRLSFSGSHIKRPFVYELGKIFNVVTNIRRAEISDSEGWVILELEADQKERGIKTLFDGKNIGTPNLDFCHFNGNKLGYKGTSFHKYLLLTDG